MSSFDLPIHRCSAVVLILLLLGFSVAAADDVSWTDDSGGLESPGCSNKFQMVIRILVLLLSLCFVFNHPLLHWKFIDRVSFIYLPIWALSLVNAILYLVSLLNVLHTG